MELNNTQQAAVSSVPQNKPAEKENNAPAAVQETAVTAETSGQEKQENELRTARKELQRIENQLSKKREQLAKLQADIAELKCRQSEMAGKIENLEAEDMGRQVLEFLKSHKLKIQEVQQLLDSVNSKPAKTKADTPVTAAAESSETE